MEVILLIIVLIIIAIFNDAKNKNDKAQREVKIIEDNASKESFKTFIDNWIKGEGIQYDKVGGYPPDWKIRRQAILLRDNYICQNCHTNFYPKFVASSSWKYEFFDSSGIPISIPNAGYILLGAHVHHKIKVRNGGTHELSNLVLLCESCHTHESGHAALMISVNTQHYQHGYRGNNKLKTARKSHICNICNKTIVGGETYYGGTYKEKNSSRYGNRFGNKIESKICGKCYQKYEYHPHSLNPTPGVSA